MADPILPTPDAGERLVDPDAGSDERLYATLCHLTLFTHAVLPIPVIVALVMWLIKKDKSPFLDDHGREAVNFQISLLIISLLIIPVFAVATCGVGALLFLVIPAVGIIGSIMGAVAANKGEFFRYPICLRLIPARRV